jgi:two-component sensor histidine kinase
MHPVLLRRQWLLLYLACWLPLLFGLAYFPVSSAGIAWAEALLLCAPPMILPAAICLSPYYGVRRLPVGRVAWWKLVAHWGVSAVIGAGVWAGAQLAWAGILAGGMAGLQADFKQRFIPLILLAGGLLYLFSVAAHYLVTAVETQQMAQTLARESELKALKMQINPHFLFNSLNSISALATIDGERAREMCLKLSEFLRATLQMGDRETIPLAEELSLVRTYLEIERIRFGRRLQIEELSDAPCQACLVPSLLIQPLVENAIKHGISGLVEGGTVRVETQCTNGQLTIRVTNPFDPDSPPARRSGVGLANIRQRLRVRYADQAKLEARVDQQQYRAEIRLPCGVAK